MPYAITVAAVSFVMFILSGVLSLFVKSFAVNVLISLPVGIVLIIGTLFIIKLITNKKQA